MATILMNRDKSLICTKYNVIRQYDNVVNSLYFLIPPIYHEVELEDFTATLYYQTPNGNVYNTTLLREEELYKDHIKFKFDIVKDFTKYGGDVRMKLSLSKKDVENGIEYMLNTGEVKVNILGVEDYYDNPNQDTIDNLEEQIAQINSRLDATPDNLVLNNITNEIYLTNAGVPVGSSINLENLGDALVNSNDDGFVKVIL